MTSKVLTQLLGKYSMNHDNFLKIGFFSKIEDLF